MSDSGTRRVRFQRANYVVSNLDRALELYVGILGLTVAFIKDSESDSYSYDVFEIDRNSAMRFAVLSAPDQPRVMALTEVASGVAPQSYPRRAAIVLEIPDIDGVLAECAAKGFEVYREEVLETHDGRTGRELGIVDDDGNLVVIYYVPPAG